MYPQLKIVHTIFKGIWTSQDFLYWYRNFGLTCINNRYLQIFLGRNSKIFLIV